MGNLAKRKRLTGLITCSTTRANHIEVVDELSSSVFINALRRFVAGKAKTFCSDHGINFIRATEAFKIDTIYVETGPVSNCLYNCGSVWIFNPPYASYMGGVWERMIGVSHRILDALIMDNSYRLTHGLFVTFMADVCAILNSRSLVLVSYDPEFSARVNS